MNENLNHNNLDARLKAADPVKDLTLDARLLQAAAMKKSKFRFDPKKFGISLGAVAAVAALAISVPLLQPAAKDSYLITLASSPSESGGAGVTPGASFASSGSAGADSMISSKMMLPWVQYEYVPGKNLSAATGRGFVYQIDLNGEPKSVLKKLADLFEISGPVKQQDPEFGSEYYTVGSQDGTGKSASVSWTGTGTWWFSDPTAWEAPQCLRYGENPDSTTPEKWCEEYEETKPTPELIPTKAEIQSTALRLFKATGLTVSSQDLVITRDAWGASASASLPVEGQDTALEWTLQWGQNGKLAYAGGQSVEIISRGEFKTISALAAVKRITDWRYGAMVGNKTIQKYAPPASEYARTYANDSSVPLELGNQDSETQEPKIQVLTIERAISALVMIYDKNGAAWLVPGYVLVADDGVSWPSTVFSLEEGIVELPDPVEIMPMVK